MFKFALFLSFAVLAFFIGGNGVSSMSHVDPCEACNEIGNQFKGGYNPWEGMGIKIVFVALLLEFLFHSNEAGTYTHQEALNQLSANGIGISSSGGCSNRYNSQCTSLDGIHTEAIDGLIQLKDASGCSGIVVTGATETGHAGSTSPSARTHSNGWKIDIRKRGEDCVTGYIKRTFTKISANRWQAASGNIYYNEHNHWDIQYGNPRRNKRDLDSDSDVVDDDKSNELDIQSENSQRSKRDATSDCLSAICAVESGCRPLGCSWDVNSLSCGYFQIKRDYYVDCYMPGKQAGESVDSAWKRCASDYDCSTECVIAYNNRYVRRCQGKGPCQAMARLHNGGPNGCNKGATVGYWNRVYANL